MKKRQNPNCLEAPSTLSFLQVLFLCSVIFLASCARAPIKDVNDSMRKASAKPELEDELILDGMNDALDKTILEFKKNPNGKLRFGPRRIDRAEYIQYLETLRDALLIDPTHDAFWRTLDQLFEINEVYGDKNWGEVFITSYYEPVIPGSLKKTDEFSQPLYKTPPDLLSVNFNEYVKAIPSYKDLYQAVVDEKSRDGVIRGRVRGSDVVPYFSRDEIDRGGALKGKKLELVWVRPSDAFFLQIQGSGRVHISDKLELKVGYSAQNGHPYVPIGRFLLDRIPKEEMSMQKIEAEMKSMSLDDQYSFMAKNPSYVFFQELTTDPLTKFGAEVIPGRTIATDQKYFPKGALAFLEFEKPIFTSSEDAKPSMWIKAKRLVFDHDVGGAIRGPHRVDLFWGRGEEAKQVSGIMRNPGRLYYFVPKAGALTLKDANALPQ